MTKKILFIVLLAAFACSTAISQKQLTEVDLTVNGIRSGSSAAQVKKLGKPLKIRIIGFDECANQYRRVLDFGGLEVGILGSKDGKRASVMSLTVRSSKWSIAPGVRIGASSESLMAKYGKPVSEDSSQLSYVTKGNLGGVTFHLRKGRLFRVEMMETLC